MQRDKRPIFIVRPLSPESPLTADVISEAFTYRTSTASAGRWSVEVLSDALAGVSEQTATSREKFVEVCLRSSKMTISSSQAGAVGLRCESSSLRQLAAAILAAANESETDMQEVRHSADSNFCALKDRTSSSGPFSFAPASGGTAAPYKLRVVANAKLAYAHRRRGRGKAHHDKTLVRDGPFDCYRRIVLVLARLCRPSPRSPNLQKRRRHAEYRAEYS